MIRPPLIPLPSWSARLGKAGHKAFQLHAEAGRVNLKAVAEQYRLTPRQGEILANLHAQWLLWATEHGGPQGWRTEVAYAYDPETGKARELSMKHERDYSQAKPHEICGTADFIVPGEAPWVGDYKTGRGWVPDALENMQLRGLNMMVAKTLDVGRTRGSVVRISEIGVFAPAPVDFDQWEIEVVQEELGEIHRKRKLGMFDANPGKHCGMCPHKNSCKAHRATSETMQVHVVSKVSAA